MRYRPDNPDFQPPAGGLKAEHARMVASPATAPRPIVVLAGWRAARLPSAMLARKLHRLVGSAQTLAIAFPLHFRFESAAAYAVRLISERFPSPDASTTVKVDVVGISMGGLIARLAAMPRAGEPHLRIARLFTLGTPHRGAKVAHIIRPDPTVRDMRPGSAFLQQLDEALPRAEYELTCYARLGDSWVGARNTAPPGHDPIWTRGPRLMSHVTISSDALIITDIARRIRNEPPLAVRASPPPRD